MTRRELEAVLAAFDQRGGKPPKNDPRYCRELGALQISDDPSNEGYRWVLYVEGDEVISGCHRFCVAMHLAALGIDVPLIIQDCG